MLKFRPIYDFDIERHCILIQSDTKCFFSSEDLPTIPYEKLCVLSNPSFKLTNS